MKTNTQHTPTVNEIITDISGIAHKWPEETRLKVFRAVNAHEKLMVLARYALAVKNTAEMLGEKPTENEISLFSLAAEAIAKTEGGK